MKIMITGAEGQLGNDCRRVFAKAHQLILVDIKELDITRPADVNAAFEEFKPELVINCAAYTAVDACETQKEDAWAVNASGPCNLAQSAARWGGRLVHISTDYVFDGQKPIADAYVETDDPNPLSVYGLTKLEGEKAVREATEHHVILRTAWMYGADGHNFLKTILKLALSNPGKEIKVVNDQFGSPTWSYRLARQIAALVLKDARGTYHATAEGFCTWYELADYFLKKMNVTHHVVPCTTEEFPTAAVRPKNSILENRRLKDAGINIMAPWQQDVEQYVDQFGEKLIHEVTGRNG